MEDWCEYNYTTDCERDHVLWWKSLIRVNNLPILWLDAVDKGLLRVSDLYTEKGILPIEVIKQKYGISTMLCNSLIAAIPRKMKAFASQLKKGKKDISKKR